MNEKINRIIDQLKSMGYDDAKISKYFDAQYDVLKQNVEEEKRRLDAERDLSEFYMQIQAKNATNQMLLEQQEARRQADAYINQEFMEKHFPRR